MNMRKQVTKWVTQGKTNVWIAKKVGVSDSSIRRWKNKWDLVSPPKFHEISDIEISEKVAFEQEILTLQKTLRDTRNKLATSYKENHAIDMVLAQVQASVKAIPYLKPPKVVRSKKKRERETAVSLISCIHMGEVVSKEEMGGLGEYNFAIFLERAQTYEDSLVKLLQDILTGYEWKELRILGLGDFISGIIHQELLETNEFPIVEQVFKTAAVMAQVFVNLHRRLGIPINFEGVVGNHGRVKQEYYFKNTYVNWDYVTYVTMQLFCQNYPEITFKLPKSFFNVTDIEGKKFLYFHGNHIKSWNQIPWYGINRTAVNFQALLAGHGQSYDYMVLAHFHQSGMVDAVKGEYIMNGTWKGGDEYALGRLSVVANPRQWLFGVNPEFGITWRIPIALKVKKIVYDERYKVQAYGEIADTIKALKR